MNRICWRHVVNLIWIIVLVACGCGTSDDEVQKSVRMELLTANTWKISKAMIAGKEDTADNSKYRIKLNQDGTYQTTEVDGTQRNGTWTFNDDATKAILQDAGNGVVLEFVIVKLTENELKVTFTLVVLFEWTLVPA
jgi:hypothetical protein